MQGQTRSPLLFRTGGLYLLLRPLIRTWALKDKKAKARELACPLLRRELWRPFCAAREPKSRERERDGARQTHRELSGACFSPSSQRISTSQSKVNSTRPFLCVFVYLGLVWCLFVGLRKCLVAVKGTRGELAFIWSQHLREVKDHLKKEDEEEEEEHSSVMSICLFFVPLFWRSSEVINSWGL